MAKQKVKRNGAESGANLGFEATLGKSPKQYADKAQEEANCMNTDTRLCGLRT